jgi:hypothetical protein
MSRNFQVVSMCSSGNGGLARQVQQHRRVLADRIEHDRQSRLRCHLAQDVDALRLERLQVRRMRYRHHLRFVPCGHVGTAHRSSIGQYG